MSDIFISYASEDKAVAQALADGLKEYGWSVWWDRRLTAGSTFRDEIEQALKGARCVVVLWSVHSVHSPFVRDEADAARQRGCLVPAVLDDTQPPLGFREIHFVNWSGSTSDESFQQLLEGVRSFVADPSVAAPVAGRRQDRFKAVDWIWLALMVIGVMLTLYVIPSSVVDDARLNTIAHFVSWALGGGILARLWQSPATVMRATRVKALQAMALLLFTAPWLFIFPLVTIRPTLAPPGSRFAVTIEGEKRELPEFSVPLRKAAVVLTGADGTSTFDLHATDLFWTFLRVGSRWLLLEPEWRLTYDQAIDCFGQGCPVPVDVLFTLDGRADNRDGIRTDEGASIRFDRQGRRVLKLRAGEYTVTSARGGKPCVAPPARLVVPHQEAMYQLRLARCLDAAGQ